MSFSREAHPPTMLPKSLPSPLKRPGSLLPPDPGSLLCITNPQACQQMQRLDFGLATGTVSFSVVAPSLDWCRESE